MCEISHLVVENSRITGEECSGLGSSVGRPLAYRVGGPGFDPRSDPAFFSPSCYSLVASVDLGSGRLANRGRLESIRGYLCEITHWAVGNSRITGEECSSLGSSVVEHSPIEQKVLGWIPGLTLHFFSFLLHL